MVLPETQLLRRDNGVITVYRMANVTVDNVYKVPKTSDFQTLLTITHGRKYMLCCDFLVVLGPGHHRYNNTDKGSCVAVLSPVLCQVRSVWVSRNARSSRQVGVTPFSR